MQKCIAFIGSSVADVMLHVPCLPTATQDIHITQQQMSLGGCAFNASHIAHLLHVPYLLFSPIGKGLYGDFVKNQFLQKGIDIVLETEEENGCCYCFIEPNGERSFLSYHGAEYKFQKDWFSLLDQYPLEHIYVCGLELEEESGVHILTYIEQHPHIQYYFAPGPRFQYIEQAKITRLFQLHPILHLNKDEALQWSHQTNVEEAAQILFQQTRNTIIITLGKDGTYLYEHEVGTYISTISVSQKDTTGAGDVHIGAILTYRSMGLSFEEAIRNANIISGAVVKKTGAILCEDEFANLTLKR